MSAAVQPRQTWPTRLWGFAQGAVVVALIGSVTQCYFERQNAADLAVQQQHLTGVAQFQASGKELDLAFADFNDALARGAPLEGAEIASLRAIRVHAADTETLRPVVGDQAADGYLDALVKVRTSIEEAKGARQLGDRLTAFSDMLVKRNRLVEEARAKRI